MNEHRISPMSVAVDVSRQTQKTEFGSVLSNAVQSGIQAGGAVVNAIAGGSPVLSAAVSGINAVGGMVSAVSGAVPTAVPGSSVPAGSASTGGAVASTGNSGADMLRMQAQLQADGQSFNAQYLALQDSMQKESREFTAITNIMKVRHDSAKAAINNIR